MSKLFIELWNNVGTGVIIQYQSGVVYSNQAGGFCCLHPKLEGVFVPFCNDACLDDLTLISPDPELRGYFEGPKHRGTGATSGLDSPDADFIDSVLRKFGANRYFAVDRNRLCDSMEAWVFVTVSPGDPRDPAPLFGGFESYPRLGVLTWSNSD